MFEKSTRPDLDWGSISEKAQYMAEDRSLET